MSQVLTEPVIVSCFEIGPIAAAADAGLPSSWIQILITGKFRHPASGKFEVQASDMQAYAADIASNGARIPIDFDHDSGLGRSSRAAGWYTGQTQLLHAGELRPDNSGAAATQDELWAQVEWTAAGEQAVRTHEYRYVSPEFSYKVAGAKRTSHRMLATALTNRPFLPDMAPVRLSAAEVPNPSGDAHERKDTNVDTTVFAAALGLKDDADDKTILAALKERDETIKAHEAKVAELEKKLIPDDVIQKLTASAAKGEEAAKALHDMQRDQLLKDAVEDGRILPAQKDAFASMYDVDAGNVRALLDATPKRSFKPVGSDTPGADGGDGEPGTVTIQGSEYQVDERSHKLAAATAEVLKEQGKTADTASAEEYVAAAEVAARKLRA